MPEIPLIMPKMSMTMSEGEVIGWRKQAGDPVSAGEVVCEVLTDKVDMEVEAPVDGILDRIVANASATVPVGAPIAYIRTEADDLLGDLFTPAGPNPTTTGGQSERPTPPSRRGPKPALPGARRRAGELGIRLDDLTGTGPSGAISLADVERAAARQPAPARSQPADTGTRSATEPAATQPPAAGQPATAQPTAGQPAAGRPSQRRPVTSGPAAPARAAEPAATTAPSSGVDPGFADALAARRRSVRAAVARVMTASAAVPQFTVFSTLDLAALDQARAAIRVGWTTLLIRAFATVLRQHPELNANWGPDGPREQPEITVALAVDTPVGLLAPVLPAPDRGSLSELDRAVRRVAERARTGRLRPSDLDGATTTVSNLGGFGVDSFQALLTPPQATILSLGRIGPQPRVLPGGGLAARVSCTVGLTVDHRAADGADAARLLAELAELTAAPDQLLGGG